MSAAYTGGCACSAIRYEVSGEPVVMLDCQCRQCQHESGTGHASHLTFANAEVKVSGKATLWDMTGDTGIRKTRAFCPSCGSPVYMTFPDMAAYFVLRAGSLDEPKRFQPQMTIWTAASHPWDKVDPALPKFDKMPPR